MNNSPNLTPADPVEEIAALKQALAEKSEEIKRLQRQMPYWISTEERLPEKPGKSHYEHVDCLVLKQGYIEHLMWNCEHLCWDDEAGDDYNCDAMAVSHWMPMSVIANIPKP